MNNIIKYIKHIKHSIVHKGIPIPFFRGEESKPSVSLTLLVLSFVMWCLGITELIKDMDIDKCENMVIILASLYFGRKMTSNSKTTTLQTEEKQGEDNNVSTK